MTRRRAWFQGILLIAVMLLASIRADAVLFDDWLDGARGYEEARKQHEQSGNPLLVYFYTDWCPHCRRLNTVVLATDVAQQAIRDFVKVRINPESGPGEHQLAGEFHIGGYPSLFVVSGGSSTPRPLPIPQDADDFAKTCAAVGRVSQAVRKAATAQAEANLVTVVLKSGRRATGEVVLEDEAEVVVRRDGQLLTFKRATIDQIIRKAPPAAKKTRSLPAR